MRKLMSLVAVACVSSLMGCCHDTCDTCRDICSSCGGHGGGYVAASPCGGPVVAAPTAPAQPMPAPAPAPAPGR